MASELRDQLQTTLGDAYSLERELGGGGMSRVFMGTDTRLGRQIVVKVLPSETGGAVSIERFKREIQVAVRLQHPHIVPVLMAGEADGLPFYMMPWVKGESLRARLTKSGELSVNDTLHILRDVAAALAYAHAEGVVHRDIKPENVMLSGGVAVVTDFGVAKAMDAAAAEAGTVVSGLTSLGVALGTPAYMAPEQATADPHVDRRADIYAFGCVAYEMLAGSSPFGGRSAQQQLAAHVTESPEPLLKRRPNMPAPLAELVMTCLEKRAGDRPQSADELIAALDAIATPSGGTAPTGRRLAAASRKRTPQFVLAGGVLTGGILALAAVALWPRGSSFKPFTIGATSPIAVTPALEMEPAISPDGKLVAYAAETPAGSRIFVRQIDGGRPVLLTADLDGDHRWPRWAPDQSRIVFAAKGAAFVVPALGGSPRRVIDSPNGPVATPSWSPDGKQLAYADVEGISVRSLDGGAARKVVAGASLHSPSWSPDGTRLVYAQGLPPTLVNISTNTIWVIAAAGGSPRQLSDSIHVNVSPVWAPDANSVLYVSNRGGTRDVYQQPIRSDGNPAGAPHRLTTTLNAYTVTLSASGARMAYDVVLNRTNIWMVPIAPGAIAGTSSATRITDEKETIENMSLSHGGKWLAYDSNRGGNFDIYKVRVDGGQPMQLTNNPANDFIPAWSPDDDEIAFHSTRHGTRDVYVVSSEGGGDTQVTSGPREDFAPYWAPDRRSLVFRGDSAGVSRAYVVTRGVEGQWSAPRVATPDSVRVFRSVLWSLDGKVIAVLNRGVVTTVSADGGAVRAVADSVALGGVPTFLTWGSDASLFYVTTVTRGRISVVAVPLAGGRPRTVMIEEASHRLAREEFATDGRRIFFVLGASESDVWVMDLRR